MTNDQLLIKIIAIENMLNSIQTAISNLAPKTMLIQYTGLRQAEIELLKDRVSTAETEITSLKSRVSALE